jgi:hypothetical protein
MAFSLTPLTLAWELMQWPLWGVQPPWVIGQGGCRRSVAEWEEAEHTFSASLDALGWL